MKTSNKLIKLVTFLCVSLLVFGILACTNIVDHKQENSYIRISATTPNARTILPIAFTENTEGLNWFLTGITDDTTVTFNKSWTDTSDKTAYKNMTSEPFIIPEKGNWTFSLIAQIDGKNVLSCVLTNVQIIIGENNLSFVMTEATGDNIADGQIDFTLKFPKDIVSKATAYLYNKNDVNNSIDTEDFIVNTSEMSSVNYINESLSSGYYILKINLYQNVNDADSLINTYTCLVRVAPGLCSKGEYQLEKLAQIFTINYNTNGGNFSDPFIPTTYNTYTKFQLPTPTKVGYEFTGWYTDEDCTIEVILDDSNAYNLTANVDLYAGWQAKGSQDNPIKNWEDLEAVMTEDGGDIYISGNMTANKTLTVTKVSKLIAKEAVSITRVENFTSNFFNVSSGVSLEIAGSENSTITIDGGNSDSNPISVQSPLITVNGELTLSNCTLQNNNNSNYVGAVYVGAGTFTMNDGVTITNCKATDGGAVYITGGGTFKMTGGTITGCSATNSGGGVWMNTVSSFTMSGNSKIENCTATNNEGGGVYVTDVNNPCTFKMLDNATITGCSAEKGGGGVSYGCSTSGIFEISGNAKISNNRNNNSSYGGGGIYLYGNLTMKGGIISGNEASNGAGVYVRHDSSSFTMNGGTISDNKATVSGGGVYLSYSNSSFTMTAGTISNNLVNGINHGASIKINSGNVNLPDTIPFTGDSFTENIIDGEVQYPSGGTGGGAIALQGRSVTSETELISAIADTNVDTIIIASDFSISSKVVINRDITIAANDDFTITHSSSDYLFEVNSDTTFTLGGGAGLLTIEGSTENTIYSYGNIILKDNIALTNSSAERGVIFLYKGTLTMKGGSIYNNNSTAITSNMGDGDVEINISGGEIYNNTKNSSSFGSAIYIISSNYHKATVNIYGSAKIYNNINTSGSAISIRDQDSDLKINSTDEENNASIYNNTSSNINMYLGNLYIDKQQITDGIEPYTPNINYP